MIAFYFTLFSTFAMALGDRISNQRYEKKSLYYFVLLLMIVFIIISGLRNNIGDTEMYIHSFNIMGNTLDEVIKPDTKDKAFVFFTFILKKIWDDSQFFIFITAAITCVLNIWSLRKYSERYFELAIWMYICSGYFLVTMNGIRQSLVASFVFIATKYIIEDNFKKYALIIIVLSAFHNSVLIMLPIYFIVRMKPWSKKSCIFIGIALVCFLLWGELFPFFSKFLEETQYDQYNEMLGETGLGANPIRAIISLLPVILAYLSKETLSKNVPYSNIIINMSIINAIIMFFAMYNWIFARFTIYFQLYTFILLPIIIQYYFPKKIRNLVYFLFILFYFLFFYYEHVLSLNIFYSSKYF